jgi:hypothetical protein
MIILSLLVIWFSCYCTMMNLVIAFFYCCCITTYCMCMGCMVRYFPYTRFTVPFVPLVGASLPYCVRVLFQYTPYGKVVSVHPVYSTWVYCSYHRRVTTASYACTPVHAASYGNFGASLFVPYCAHILHVACCYTVPFVPCWYDDSTLPRSHPSRCHIRLFCELHIDHLLPQTSFSSFFLSLSASRSTPVALPLIPGEFEHCCLVVLVDCCFLVVCDCPLLMNLVISFFSYCRCVTTVSYARTVRAAWNSSFRAPAVHYRLYHAYCQCITTVSYACTGCIVR